MAALRGFYPLGTELQNQREKAPIFSI